MSSSVYHIACIRFGLFPVFCLLGLISVNYQPNFNVHKVLVEFQCAQFRCCPPSLSLSLSLSRSLSLSFSPLSPVPLASSVHVMAANEGQLEHLPALRRGSSENVLGGGPVSRSQMLSFNLYTEKMPYDSR